MKIDWCKFVGALICATVIGVCLGSVAGGFFGLGIGLMTDIFYK